MLIPGKALINFNIKINFAIFNLRSKFDFFILGLNIINSVLLTFSDILLALSQFNNFFKSKLTNLFNFLTELLLC